ncbi:DUF2255 family protein [Streptomyces triticirhizae]|uniref:DUF2255 family protein n=1 Tax=Streptomyces triticirhizae TaxID=2483353 RepID=A0A3M2M767_9ACTN|nr:DUF2255 family protein [Streptomyces triticirhizae]RMI45411.1 DUF2255 family protein [Streptomyces triticirhizae]
MATWSNEELDTIGGADELEIVPLREDGTEHGPITIWVVRHGDGLYVRSARGREGRWFNAARERHEGRVQAGGLDREVTFVELGDDGLNDAIDEAYRSKYRRYGAQYVDPIVGSGARAATLSVLPR